MTKKVITMDHHLGYAYGESRRRARGLCRHMDSASASRCHPRPSGWTSRRRTGSSRASTKGRGGYRRGGGCSLCGLRLNTADTAAHRSQEPTARDLALVVATISAGRADDQSLAQHPSSLARATEHANRWFTVETRFVPSPSAVTRRARGTGDTRLWRNKRRG